MKINLSIVLLTIGLLHAVATQQTKFLSSGPQPNVDPEIVMTAEQIIITRGYPVETHYTTTTDGYILKLYRIPYGKNQTRNLTNPNVVLIQHGLTDSSDFMICNKENRSLPFLLANQGFDVWLGNNRGNKYSIQHTTLDPAKNKTYWDFSFHEMGLYDLPAEINYILSSTNASKLIYIGHSQGTSQMFAGASLLPAYFASKLKVFIAMAPATSLANAYGGLIKTMADLYVDDFVESLGYTNLFADSASSEQQGAIICSAIHVYCESTEDLVLAHSKEDDDQNAYIVSEGHEPSGASLRSLRHYAELIRRKKFVSMTGQAYDLNNIKFPVSMHVGKDDNLATTTDNRVVRDLFKNNNVLHFYQEYDNVAHSTYMLGKEGQTPFLTDIVNVALEFKQ